MADSPSMLMPLVLLLLSGASPALVYGGPRAPQAWAAVTRGNLWVCWQAAADCWTRVPLELAHAPLATVVEEDDEDAEEASEILAGYDVDVRRVGFPDPQRLVWLDESGRAWSVRKGDLQPRLTEDQLATAATARPRAMTCSPTGWLPQLRERRFVWIEAPCARVIRCFRPPVRFRRPRLPALGMRLGLEVWRTRGLSRSPLREITRSTDAWGVAAVLNLTVDLAAARRHQLTWQTVVLASRREPDLGSIPDGPLADRHRQTLARQLCEGGG